MSNNIIDEMNEVEARDTLHLICNKMGMKKAIRNRSTIFGNVENMVSNVIKFPERESFSYIETHNKILGVTGKFDIEVDMWVDDSQKNVNLQIGNDGDYAETTRKEMAQFLWAAAYFLDSNQEWAESEYPALNK